MNQSELQRCLKVGQIAACEAGDVLLDYKAKGFKVSKKGRVNLVTEADLASEKIIVSYIQDNFPDHQILAEESGNRSGEGEFKWVIDPLDGTTNYAHRYPCYCVSIGVEADGIMQVGIIWDPERKEMFTAVRGGGAFLNGKKIEVSQEDSLVDGLFVTGFSYDEEVIEQNLVLFNRMMRAVRSVRRDGSAALNMSYVACGRFEGFWELSLHPWDIAAGSLILTEAGGKLTRINGAPTSIYDSELLATNGHIHESVSRILSRKSAD